MTWLASESWIAALGATQQNDAPSRISRRPAQLNFLTGNPMIVNIANVVMLNNELLNCQQKTLGNLTAMLNSELRLIKEESTYEPESQTRADPRRHCH